MAVIQDLEQNRQQELEQVLKLLTEKLIAYTRTAELPLSEGGSGIGQRFDPITLSKKLQIQIPQLGEGLEGLSNDVDMILENSVVTWNSGFLDKLYASTNPVGIASDMLLSILNTNSHVFTVSPALTIVENVTGREYAQMFGFDGPYAGGLTFPGGSYSNSTSLNIARATLFPDTKVKGNGAYKFAIFASAHAHYSVEKAAIFCGMGSDALVKVPVDEFGRMIVPELEAAVVQAKEDGKTPLYINCTAGTTVYGSYDDFNAIGDIAEKYKLWMHVDGSWGGNVAFSAAQRHKLAGVQRANSLTVNPHKMLGVPTTCSFLLMPDRRIMQTANSLQAPYLFHRNDSDEDLVDLADATMGCGRRPDALKLYLGWRWYGTEGYGARIDHAFEITRHLATLVKRNPKFKLVSEFPPPCLQTCFFYDLKHGDRDANTKTTKAIVEALHESQQFLVDFAPDANGQGDFFRVVVNSPVVTKDVVENLVNEIERVGSTL